MHAIAQNQHYTFCAFYFECSWKCILLKSLLSWNLSPESFRQVKLNRHSQHTDCPCIGRDALPLISIFFPCLPQRQIVPMVWLWYKVLPSSALLIWGHGVVGHFRAANPALPHLGRASLIPELHECNRDEVLRELHYSKGRIIIVNAKLTLWKLK